MRDLVSDRVPVTAVLYSEQDRQRNPPALSASTLLHEFPEWIETDLIEGKVSRFVLPQSGKSRQCCHNSMSSGYSSHSPPLSATSYGIGSSVAVKGLAIVHEGEIIPRPIWPLPTDSMSVNSPDTNSSNADRNSNHHQKCLYGSVGCRSCEGSGMDSDYSPSSLVSAREVLLQLSRTLTYVLEGHCGKTDEEILKDISRTVTKGISVDISRCSTDVYEDIYRNVSLTSGSKESTSTIGINPINSRLYGYRCYCDKENFLCHNHLLASQETSRKSDKTEKKSIPSVFLLPDQRTKLVFDGSQKDQISCNCTSYKNFRDITQNKLCSKIVLGKQSRHQIAVCNKKDIRFSYPSIIEHEYTTLECSDENASSEGVTDSSTNENTWCKNFRGFDKNLDFTLDGLKAEKLGRAITRAKRRRQWCRVFVVILGLIFFILSVVIVSLSVTKGRKVFGSM